MPAAQMPPQQDPFRHDRFTPAIRIETPSHDQRTGELREGWLRSLEQSTYLTIKYGLINAEGVLDQFPIWRRTGTLTEQSLRAQMLLGHPEKCYVNSLAL